MFCFYSGVSSPSVFITSAQFQRSIFCQFFVLLLHSDFAILYAFSNLHNENLFVSNFYFTVSS
jgi:hypothetical protein